MQRCDIYTIAIGKIDQRIEARRVLLVETLELAIIRVVLLETHRATNVTLVAEVRELLGLTLEGIIDNPREVDIRRLGKGLAHIDHTTRLLAYGVRVLHPGSTIANLDTTTKLRIVLGSGRHTLLEQSHSREQLECRTGVDRYLDSVVATLNASILHPLEVCHSQDITRRDLHHNGCSPIGILRYELLLEGGTCHILQIDIERGDHIVTILNLDILLVADAGLDTRSQHLPHLHTVLALQGIVHTALYAIGFLTIGSSDGTQCKVALRIDTVATLLHRVGHIVTITKQRIATNLLPLVLIDITEYRTRDMFARLYSLRTQRDQLFVVLLGTFVAKECCKFACQCVSVIFIGFRCLETVVTEVDNQLAACDGDRQRLAIAGIDCASAWRQRLSPEHLRLEGLCILAKCSIAKDAKYDMYQKIDNRADKDDVHHLDSARDTLLEFVYLILHLYNLIYLIVVGTSLES